MVMKKIVSVFAVFLLLFSFCNSGRETSNSIPAGYDLVWFDEFDYTGKPDPSKWAYEYGHIANNEAQYYTDSLKNARVENGTLIIEAYKEKIKNSAFVSNDDPNWKKNSEYASYTSARLITRNIAYWQYGVIEIKAKIPRGTGMWPAIWMLGKNQAEVGWPKCGEIDIMEHVGYNQDSVFGTIHTGAYNHMMGTQKGSSVYIENPYDQFHTYSIEWTPEKIDFLLDGAVYFNVINEHKTAAEWPFDQPFYMILNIAVGGSWGGVEGIDDSVFPQQMVVDYVRVYQIK
jgi:beta-glucanase (GH16 family)